MVDRVAGPPRRCRRRHLPEVQEQEGPRPHRWAESQNGRLPPEARHTDVFVVAPTEIMDTGTEK